MEQASREVMESHCWTCLKDVLDVAHGSVVRLGSVELLAELDDLKGLFQPK